MSGVKSLYTPHSQRSEIYVEPPKKIIDGVVPKAAEAVYYTLVSERFYYGSAGAGLSHQAYNPDYAHKNISRTSAQVGISAEKKTSEFIRNWIVNKAPNAILVDSVHIRGFGDEEVNEETGVIEGGDTDHVLLIGDEVLIIDTKRWKKRRSYSISDKGAILRSTGKGKPQRPFPGGRINTTSAVHMWRNFLENEAYVTGLIVVNAPSVYVVRNKNWYKQPYRVVEFDKLEEWLDQKYEKMSPDNKEKINSSLVAQAVVSAIKPFDEFKAMGLSL